MFRGPLHEKRLKLPVGERPPKPLEWAEGEEAQPQHAGGNVRLTSRNGKNRTLRPVTLRIIWHRILRAIWHNSPSKVRADRARRASDRSRRRRAGLFLIARAAGLG
jgi:hypothetical protein